MQSTGYLWKHFRLTRHQTWWFNQTSHLMKLKYFIINLESLICAYSISRCKITDLTVIITKFRAMSRHCHTRVLPYHSIDIPQYKFTPGIITDFTEENLRRNSNLTYHLRNKITASHTNNARSLRITVSKYTFRVVKLEEIGRGNRLSFVDSSIIHKVWRMTTHSVLKGDPWGIVALLPF